MYTEFFGLAGKPFQLSPDARFFFPSKEHKRALSFLQYGLSQGDGFIVITGDVGTGKTTVVQTLLDDLDPKETVVANLVTTQLQEDDLLSLVAVNFGLKIGTPNKALLLRDLEQLFLQRNREGKRVLLIVDEAQNLPPRSVEELRMLSNFQHAGKPLVQVFLLGQEEFRSTLMSEGFEQLRQRVIATYHLNPLDAEETRTYIEHRLGRVAWHNDPSIDDGAFDRIFAFTGGVPRRINNLCDRVLLYAYLEERHAIDEEMIQLVAEEIGSEFLVGGSSGGSAAVAAASENASHAVEPLETMARVMFDKANVQQRLSAIERAVDALGHSMKDELVVVQALLEELRLEIDGLRSELSEGQRKKKTVA